MDYKNFEVTSQVAAERYQVEFAWLQTAISLRRSDTVDVKFLVNGMGKVVALPHGPLEQACSRLEILLSDDLCLRIAAEYIRGALLTGSDAEKDLLAVPPSRLEELVGAQLERAR